MIPEFPIRKRWRDHGNPWSSWVNSTFSTPSWVVTALTNISVTRVAFTRGGDGRAFEYRRGLVD